MRGPASHLFIGFIPFVGFSTMGSKGAVMVLISQPDLSDPLDMMWTRTQSLPRLGTGTQ
jgi:hypothetical protein